MTENSDFITLFEKKPTKKTDLKKRALLSLLNAVRRPATLVAKTDLKKRALLSLTGDENGQLFLSRGKLLKNN